MSTLERIRHEVREIGLVTVYFLVCFLVFLSLKYLLLADYDVEVSIMSTAVVGALVVAKVVVLLDKTSFGDRFRSAMPLVHIFWRSLGYTAVVFGVTLVEHVFGRYRAGDDLGTALSGMWTTEEFNHFLAMNLCIGLAFLVYNCVSEVDRHLGEGGLRRVLLRPGRSGSGG